MKENSNKNKEIIKLPANVYNNFSIFNPKKKLNIQNTQEINEQIVLTNSLTNSSTYQNLIDLIGISNYNIRIYFIVSLFFFADGGEMQVLSLILPTLSNKWNLNSTKKSLLGSMVFVGIFFGSLICGKFSDTNGRRIVFIFGSLITSIFALCSAFTYNYLTFLIFRGLCGLGIGLSMPSGFSLFAEITPMKYRPFSVIMIIFFFPIGEIFVVFLTKIFLPYENGWRFILAFASLPALLALFLSISAYESPKFLLTKKRYKEGFEILDNILKSSDLNLELSENIKEKLIEEFEENEKVYENVFDKDKDSIFAFNNFNKENLKNLELKDFNFAESFISKNEDNNSNNNKTQINLNLFSSLVNKKYRIISLLTWGIFICISLVLYGMIYILPQVLEKFESLNKINNTENIENISIDTNESINKENIRELSDNLFLDLILNAFLEIPSMIFATYLASFGRKKAMAIGFFVSFIASLLSIFSKNWFFIGISFLKFFICIPDVVIYLYICEAFPTQIRSLALGVGSSFSRIGGILTPFFTQLLFDFFYLAPFYLFAITSFFGYLCTMNLPFETMGMNIR